ncbi:MAG TPA: hypothetical protein VIG40_05630 [Tissierellaceae bacterium]
MHLKTAFNDLINVLKEEKQALINNDLDLLVNIIKDKEEKVDILSNLISYNDFSDENENIKTLVEEVKNLQETNFLLTEQAMSYHSNLMDSILKVLEDTSKSNTYSKDGSYENSNQSTLIDKRI